MVGPGCNEQVAAVLARQAVRFVRKHLTRRFARPGHVWQRPRQLPVPGLEWMSPRSPIAELEAVVTALDHMNHPARRHGIGIVIDREQPAGYVAANAKRG